MEVKEELIINEYNLNDLKNKNIIEISKDTYYNDKTLGYFNVIISGFGLLIDNIKYKKIIINLPNLKYLGIRNNNYIQEVIINCNNLYLLMVQETILKYLNLNNLINLKDLYFANNKYLTNLIIDKLINLNTLIFIKNNNLKYVNIKNLINLKNLYIFQKFLIPINISKLINLENIKCQDSIIQYDKNYKPKFNIDNLNIEIIDNIIKDDNLMTYNNNNNNNINNEELIINDSNLEELKEKQIINYNKNYELKFDQWNIKGMFIKILTNKYKKITINIINLNILYCFNCNIEKLHFINCNNLYCLNCDNNNLTKLNLNNLLNLKILSCNNNKLNKLIINKLLNLEILLCFNNNLINLNIDNLINLIALNIKNNKFKIFNIDKLINLKYIKCDDNILLLHNQNYKANIYNKNMMLINDYNNFINFMNEII